MAASLPAEPGKSSRRAVLAGAIAGIGAWAASAIGRADPVRAEGQAVVVGGEYLDATSVTLLANNANNANVFWAQSNGSGAGVVGVTSTGDAVNGLGYDGYGVVGNSSGTGNAGVIGHAYANNTGVLGYSDNSGFSSSARPAGKAKTGVYGYAAQDSSSSGVYGESPTGRAVVGLSSAGYAGYFAGRVYTTKWYELTEISAPAAPLASRARLFVRDSGGKTQLCVRFPTGAVQVISTEP